VPRRDATLEGRRKTRRYPTEAVVTYKVIEGQGKGVLAGVGRSVNLSAGGLLFDSDAGLPVGSTVEVSVAWPARLNDTVWLKLWLVGHIVRSQGTLTAVRTMRHEFRTRSSVGTMQACGAECVG